MWIFDYELVPEARLIIGSVIIALCIYAIYKQMEVRLALLTTAFILSLLAGKTAQIVLTFLKTFSDYKFVVPICCAMGFAYVLRHTGCDQHLIHLLVKPLTKVRFLLIPGTIVVGFFVNMPIISQTSTVVTLGPVVIPILLAARISPATIGAVLLMGCSIGGELLNPGAPELHTTITESARLAPEYGVDPETINEQRCIQRIVPLNFIGLAVAISIFWFLSQKHERKYAAENATQSESEVADTFKVNYLMAAVPLVPILLLYLTGPPLQLIHVDYDWLTEPMPGMAEGQQKSWLVGFSMLVGAAVASVVVWRKAADAPRAFFEGAGFGFTNIISLIVVATCFGQAVKDVGIANLIREIIERLPGLLLPMAGVLSWGFAILCGSGMASTQSLFGFFVRPAYILQVDPVHVGAVVSLASAAGRTMSPVAAVVLMTAALTKVSPMELIRRIAWPLIAAVLAIIVVAMITAPSI